MADGENTGVVQRGRIGDDFSGQHLVGGYALRQLDGRQHFNLCQAVFGGEIGVGVRRRQAVVVEFIGGVVRDDGGVGHGNDKGACDETPCGQIDAPIQRPAVHRGGVSIRGAHIGEGLRVAGQCIGHGDTAERGVERVIHPQCIGHFLPRVDFRHVAGHAPGDGGFFQQRRRVYGDGFLAHHRRHVQFGGVHLVILFKIADVFYRTGVDRGINQDGKGDHLRPSHLQRRGQIPAHGVRDRVKRSTQAGGVEQRVQGQHIADDQVGSRNGVHAICIGNRQGIDDGIAGPHQAGGRRFGDRQQRPNHEGRVVIRLSADRIGA